MHEFSHTFRMNASTLFIFLVLVYNLIHILRFLYVYHNFCCHTGYIPVFHTHQSLFLHVRKADIPCRLRNFFGFLPWTLSMYSFATVFVMFPYKFWIKSKVVFSLFKIICKQLLLRCHSMQFFDIPVHEIWRFNFLVHKCSFFFLLACTYPCMAWHILSLMPFSTIRSISTALKSPIFNSFFFRHNYYANRGPKKCMQDQTRIFLCICWGSFRIHQLITLQIYVMIYFLHSEIF